MNSAVFPGSSEAFISRVSFRAFRQEKAGPEIQTPPRSIFLIPNSSPAANQKAIRKPS